MLMIIVCLAAGEVEGYQRYIDQDCGGNDYVGPNTVTFASECGEMCDTTPECVGFVIDNRKTVDNCHLKNYCKALTDLIDVYTYKRTAGMDLQKTNP